MAQFLTVLLSVLKILGLVIGGIIGLVLLILLIVLLVPIRYSIDGFYKAGEYDFSAKASWLLHIISVKYNLQKENGLVIRIFGIKLKDKKEQTEEQTEEHTEQLKEHVQVQDTVQVANPLDDSVEKHPEDTEEKVSKKHHRKKFCKQHRRKKDSTRESLYDKIKKYIDIVKTDEFRYSFMLCKDRISKILKAVFPKNWEIEGVVGFDDPSTNGKVCGVLGALFYWIRKHIFVTVDFDREIIDIKGHARGRIFLIVFVAAFLRVWFNKDIKSTIKMFKNVNTTSEVS